jgi:hypothetical protein
MSHGVPEVTAAGGADVRGLLGDAGAVAGWGELPDAGAQDASTTVAVPVASVARSLLERIAAKARVPAGVSAVVGTATAVVVRAPAAKVTVVLVAV